MSGREGEPPGPVEARVRQDLEALVVDGGVQGALAEIAFSLARSLDEGAGMSAAAVARELRAALAELVKGAAGDDDDDVDGLSTPVHGDPGTAVPAPVGDAPAS
jgi:hypothetical protein